jgi:tetratricopeptide (TPR) repeat protein
MSLVNDMLQDLETRWPQADQVQSEDGIGGVRLAHRAAEHSDTSAPEALRYKANNSRNSGPWLLVFSGVAVFLTIVVGHYFWSLEPLQPSQSGSVAPPIFSSLEKVLVEGKSSHTAENPRLEPVEQTAVRAIDDIKSKLLLPETVVREGDTAVNQVVAFRVPPTVDSLLSPEPVSEGSLSERIDGLMAEGDAALRLDRLTTPKEDNAYDRYMAVLALKPDHQPAQRGLNQVRIRYLEIVEIAIIKKYYYKVPELIRKARELGVSQVSIDRLIAGLPEKDGKPTKEVLHRIAEYEASRGLQGKTKTLNTSVMAEPTADSNNLESSVSTPSTVITSSISQRDKTIAMEAQNLIHANQLSAAQFLLENFLGSQPASIYAYREMFNLRLQQGKIKMAEAMINDADHLPGGVFSYMVAQLLIHREDYKGALRALESQSPSIKTDASYYALQAGVYHKLGRHTQAAQIYRELLKQDVNNPTHWLGLAVALDATEKQGALAAFQKVQQLAVGSESFLSYVRSRIGVLASNR